MDGWIKTYSRIPEVDVGTVIVHGHVSGRNVVVGHRDAVELTGLVISEISETGVALVSVP